MAGVTRLERATSAVTVLRSNQLNYTPWVLIKLVGLARIELARPCGQQILSLQRLPVPPQAQSWLGR